MRKLKLTKETIRIYKMLDFHLRYAPLGLLPFMDDGFPMPTIHDIREIQSTLHTTEDLGVRVKGGDSIPEAQWILEHADPYRNIIEQYGGIDQIRDVFREWEERYPQKGKMVRQWSTKGAGKIRTMSDVATGSGFTDASVPYRVRRAYLIDIAYDIYVRQCILCA